MNYYTTKTDFDMKKTCDGKCDTCVCKETIQTRMAQHVEESLSIRQEVMDYFDAVNFALEMDEDVIHRFIKTCRFDKLNTFVDELPKVKLVSNLKKDDCFYNPSSKELLQCIKVESGELEGTVTVTAIHEDNELSKYLFDLKDRVIIKL